MWMTLCLPIGARLIFRKQICPGGNPPLSGRLVGGRGLVVSVAFLSFMFSV